jgi:predicted dehydrogenase
LRWGVVGTGGIANRLTPQIQAAEGAVAAAVSSRRMESAQSFAAKHGLDHAFDSWQKMFDSDVIDAVYIATPTSVREEIAVAAARAGKHVLGEKPFASLESVQRIVAACRENGVGFMDGTHFPHMDRTGRVVKSTESTGRPWSLDSAFQFRLGNKNNIRLNPDLEPYGAIGDAGWYNMRAAVEYMPDDVELVAADTYMTRDEDTGGCNAASGVLRFSDGSTSTWNCGLISGALVQELRISGPQGAIWIDDFVFVPGSGNDERFRLQTAGNAASEVVIPFSKPAATFMFEDFAHMVNDPALLDAGVRATERTQAWLDAAWESALANEAKGR